MNMCHYRICLIFIFLSTVFMAPAFAETYKVMVADFNEQSLQAWQARSFKGQTDYQIIQHGSESVLKATANNAASGLIMEKRIDLFETPYLNWRWKVSETLPATDERSKQGDDYAARIYVVIDGGALFWNTQALNYVWSSQQPIGANWPNAYAPKNAHMLALQSGRSQSIWYREKRNVYNDFIALFGDKGSDEKNAKAYRFIDAIALMSDTDNGAGNAVAYYDDLYFSAE